MRNLKAKVHQKTRQVSHLQARIQELTIQSGVRVDASLHDDLETIMHEMTAGERGVHRTFNKLFDHLNVRSLQECVLKRKPDMRPFRSPDDPRLDVCFN